MCRKCANKLTKWHRLHSNVVAPPFRLKFDVVIRSTDACCINSKIRQKRLPKATNKPALYRIYWELGKQRTVTQPGLSGSDVKRGFNRLLVYLTNSLTQSLTHSLTTDSLIFWLTHWLTLWDPRSLTFLLNPQQLPCAELHIPHVTHNSTQNSTITAVATWQKRSSARSRRAQPWKMHWKFSTFSLQLAKPCRRRLMDDRRGRVCKSQNHDHNLHNIYCLHRAPAHNGNFSEHFQPPASVRCGNGKCINKCACRLVPVQTDWLMMMMMLMPVRASGAQAGNTWMQTVWHATKHCRLLQFCKPHTARRRSVTNRGHGDTVRKWFDFLWLSVFSNYK